MRRDAPLLPSVYSVLHPAANILDFDASSAPEREALSTLLTSRAENVISLHGTGGVGKTTLLQALPMQPCVRRKFHDAIWMFSLGPNATPAAVKHEMLTFVSQLCDKQLCDKSFVETFRNVLLDANLAKKALASLVHRLATMHVLLIFDDVWPLSADVLQLFQTLLTEIRSLQTASLKMMFATRVKQLAIEGCAIEVLPLISESDMPRRMLSWYAGIDSAESSRSHDDNLAIKSILEKCCGLPLALAVAGRGVKSRRRNTDVAVSPWQWYAEELAQRFQLLGQECQHHPGLFSSLQLSLEALEDMWTVDEINASQVFRSLCVMRKQTVIPMHTVQRMWRVSECDARMIAEIFQDNSLISVEWQGELAPGGKLDGLRIHDLMYDISNYLAQVNDESKQWHERLLSGYAQEASVNSPENTTWPRWDMPSTDAYLEENVVRHLVESGRTDDALQLLTDYRWIQRLNDDLKRIPFQIVISDMELLKKKIEKDKDIKVRTVAKDIDVIVRTMEMGMAFCTKHRAECPFQLHGRLEALESDSTVINRLIWSIAEYAKLPWVRAGPRVLTSVESQLKRVIPVGCYPWCVEKTNRQDEVAVGGNDGELRIMSVRDGAVRCKIPGHKSRVVAMCFDSVSQRMYSCSSDGILLISKDEWGGQGLEKDKAQTFQIDVLKPHEGVRCMQFISPGVVVVGTRFGRIMKFDVAKGRVTKTVKGHRDTISSMAVARSKGLLVSASWDGTLQLWDMNTLVADGDALEGYNDELYCVAMSANGKMMAAGSIYGDVDFWDVRQRKKISSPFLFHSHSVWSVGFNNNGSVLYSGSFDEIIVWDVSNWDATLEEDSEGDSDCDSHSRITVVRKLKDSRMSYINALQCSDNDSELVALTINNKIFVWKAKEQVLEQDTDDLQPGEFPNNVDWFALSPDEATIATYDQSERIIEIRNVNDVCAGTDKAIASYELSYSIYSIRMIAVSNDQRFVVFAQKAMGSEFVVDMQSGELVRTSCVMPSLGQLLPGSDTADSETSVAELDATCTSDGDEVVTFKPSSLIVQRIKTPNVENVIRSYVAGIKGNKNKIPTLQRKAEAEIRWFPGSLSWNISPRKDSVSSTTAAQKSTALTTLSDPERLTGNEPHLVGDKYDVKLSDGVNGNTYATLDHMAHYTQYSRTNSRLWIRRGPSMLNFVDLIHQRAQIPAREEPILPQLFAQDGSPAETGTSAPSATADETYDVFISHAGPHKELARVIKRKMAALQMRAFVDDESMRGGDRTSHDLMDAAIGTARAAVFILSRYFGERDWTMRELDGFLQRHAHNEKLGRRGPVLLPVFYSNEWYDFSKCVLAAYFEQRLGVDAGRRVTSHLQRISKFPGVERRGQGTDDLASEIARRMRAALDETYGDREQSSSGLTVGVHQVLAGLFGFGGRSGSG